MKSDTEKITNSAIKTKERESIIAIASGKGGTGKTLVATSLALASDEDIQFLDCDVEEPNAYVFLKPQLQETIPVILPFPKIDAEKCTGCGQCVHVCPYGVATIDPASKKASICDLCGGEPECVKICPENALIYVDSEKAAVYKRLTFSRLQRKELTPYAPYP